MENSESGIIDRGETQMPSNDPNPKCEHDSNLEWLVSERTEAAMRCAHDFDPKYVRTQLGRALQERMKDFSYSDKNLSRKYTDKSVKNYEKMISSLKSIAKKDKSEKKHQIVNFIDDLVAVSEDDINLANIFAEGILNKHADQLIQLSASTKEKLVQIQHNQEIRSMKDEILRVSLEKQQLMERAKKNEKRMTELLESILAEKEEDIQLREKQILSQEKEIQSYKEQIQSQDKEILSFQEQIQSYKEKLESQEQDIDVNKKMVEYWISQEKEFQFHKELIESQKKDIENKEDMVEYLRSQVQALRKNVSVNYYDK